MWILTKEITKIIFEKLSESGLSLRTEPWVDPTLCKIWPQTDVDFYILVQITDNVYDYNTLPLFSGL